MGRFSDFFKGRSVGAFVERARRKMGAGKLEEASRIIHRGLELYPASAALLDLQLSVRRACAHTDIRALEVRIEERGDPHAIEELIDLYQRLELPEQALRRARAYAENFPDRDAPHLILGKMHLESFLEELRAPHAHRAHDHLLRAAGLNALAVQPRMLLAELYFCVGADHSLAVMMQAVDKLAPQSSSLEAAMDVVWHLDDDGKEDQLDGIFERVECEGRLLRAPEDWPLSGRRGLGPTLQEEQADGALMDLCESGVVDEVLVMRSDGSVMSHVTPTGIRGENPAMPGVDHDPNGLLGLVRAVASKVLPQATEFDLGKFRRCTIQGRFGNVVIGRVNHTIAGARGPMAVEPHRLWQRLCAELDVGGTEAAR